MKITKPDYYDKFRCLAGSCPDSCCKEWDIQVDAASAERYRSLPGALGDDLRRVLTDCDGETVMEIISGRCPMWRKDGLCRIQAELGEHALCRTCREFPRLTHDYGDFQEWGLELSCPEAARLILSCPEPGYSVVEVPGGIPGEYDREAMEVLLRTRAQAEALLLDRSHPFAQTLALVLLYGYQAQAELDGEDAQEFDADCALQDGEKLAESASLSEFLCFFAGLEILTDAWRELLASPAPAGWSESHRCLALYLIRRYYLQAVSDYDLISRIKFILISCLAVQLLGGDPIRTAQLYSKEIENDIDNLDAILDAAYDCPAFTDRKILGMLLQPVKP